MTGIILLPLLLAGFASASGPYVFHGKFDGEFVIFKS